MGRGKRIAGLSIKSKINLENFYKNINSKYQKLHKLETYISFTFCCYRYSINTLIIMGILV